MQQKLRKGFPEKIEVSDFHKPVLLQEILDFLKVSKGKKYIDATLGGGGHTWEILKHGGIVLGIDHDQDAISHVEGEIKNSQFRLGEDLIIVKGNFRDIDEIAHLKGFENISGILFDLGVSSHQIGMGERGFSFQKDAVLDMRMDKELGVTAADLLNVLSKKELYELFTKFGEEPRARAISNIIVESRRVRPIKTTEDLVGIIAKGYGRTIESLSPAHRANLAKRVFQALRIVVNDEINNLQKALEKAPGLLEKGGKIAIISFHSLEDRIVKKTFEDWEEEGKGVILTKKPVLPTTSESLENRRARSAKLRVFEIKKYE